MESNSIQRFITPLKGNSSLRIFMKFVRIIEMDKLKRKRLDYIYFYFNFKKRVDKMFDNLDDFKKKALDNKANLKFKTISIPIGDGEQEFRITGIGEKAIKIEKYVKYEDMMDAVMDGKDEGLEAIIMEFIEDFE